jgi:hypothetical protein
MPGVLSGKRQSDQVNYSLLSSQILSVKRLYGIFDKGIFFKILFFDAFF